MVRRVKHVVVVGAGSAGFMSALTFRLALAGLEVTVVRSPKIPIIGVGESTTLAAPRFLHELLRLDRKQFFAEVRPSWKLGIRYEWGRPGDYHFNYTFDPCVDVQLHGGMPINGAFCLRDMQDASLCYALMDQKKAPCKIAQGRPQLSPSVAYHIENKAYVGYLERKTRQYGATIVEADVVDVERDAEGYVTALRFEDGRKLAGDLFIDCTGFASFLLGRQMGAKFQSYADSLFVDTAVVGSWPRSDEPINPYTTATTMDHGWAWRIDFEDHITRGYVHASDFCTPEEAMRELKEKNPRIGEMRTIKFKSGRYDHFWIKNVVAVGNSGGFVEPLEATALHMVIEHLRLVRQALLDANGLLMPAMIEVQNTRFRILWDDIRDFLAIHYKFNRQLDTPFWRHCRENVNLAGAQPIVDLYRAAGPTSLLTHVIPANTIFGLNGYLSMLIGQQAPTDYHDEPRAEHRQTFDNYRQQVRCEAAQAIPVKEALAIIHSPQWNWPQPGR